MIKKNLFSQKDILSILFYFFKIKKYKSLIYFEIEKNNVNI